jgi:hypothetical protein
MLDRLRSPGAGKAMVWISSLVLIAGVVAFVTVSWGRNDPSPSAGGSLLPETVPDDIGLETTPPPKVDEVPRAARAAAGQFILAAAGRDDLPKAWRLSHPELKAQCACTYRQWLTGNIPVQPIEARGLDQVTFFVEELAARRVVMQVFVKAAPNSDFEDQTFHIGLKASGSPNKLTWLVDLWSPISPIPVPLNPTG